MSRWIDSIAGETSNSSAGSSNELSNWPALMALLATENLRTLTEDTINALEIELHAIIAEVRNISDDTAIHFTSSKNALLQNLRNASIQLNLAWGQLESKGKTPRYYQYLLVCQEYLEKAYKQYTDIIIKNREDSDQNSGTDSFIENPTTRGEASSYELMNTQQLFQQTYDLFNTRDEIWPDQCNQAVANLHTASQPIQNVLVLLNDSLELPPGTSPLSYELMGKLYQLNEQARTLASLINSLRPLCQTKSKQAIKIRENIIIKLDSFNKTYYSILPHINLFLNKYRSLKRKHTRQHRLTLVKTPEEAERH